MKEAFSSAIGIIVLSTALVFLAGCPGEARYDWEVHDMSRPRPEVVTPGENPCEPPSDAIVLFDGTDLSQWESAKDSGPAKWLVKEGYMEVAKDSGYIQTKEKFGDYQLHIEWASPAKISGEGQGNDDDTHIAGTWAFTVQVTDQMSRTFEGTFELTKIEASGIQDFWVLLH